MVQPESGGSAVGRRSRSRSSGAPPVWFGIPFAIAGVAVLIFGVLALREELRLGAEGVTVKGIVTSKTFHEGTGDDSDSYYLNYEFVDPATGRTYGDSTSVGRGTYLDTSEGAPIDITYLPSDPTHNRAGAADPQLLPPFAVMGVGLVFAIAGSALLATSLRARRRGTAAAAAPGTVASAAPGAAIDPSSLSEGELRRVDLFTRSPIRVYVELLLMPLGGIGFLGLAAWLVTQVATDPQFILFAGLAGFFGILLLSGVPTVLRRGLGRILLEVGPDGLLHRDAGRFAWSEIAELRVERSRGVAGKAGTATYTRLGIVPRDPARAASLTRGLAWRMTAAFIRFANRMARERGGREQLTEIDAMAPLGVYAYELEQPFDELVASIRRYAAVGAPLMAPAPRPLATSIEGPGGMTWALSGVAPGPGDSTLGQRASATETPLSDAELRDLDAHLGTSSHAGATVSQAIAAAAAASAPSIPAPAGGATAAAAQAAPMVVAADLVPRVTATTGPQVFRRRGFTASDVLSLVMPGESTSLPPVAGVIGQAILGVVFMVGPTLIALSIAVSSGGRDLSFVVLPIAMAAVFIGGGWWTLRGTRRRWEQATGSAELLTVGPDGLVLGDGRSYTWSQIISVDSTGSRLLIRPVGAAEDEAITLDFDMFEADDDEILDAIAQYKVVEEP